MRDPAETRKISKNYLKNYMPKNAYRCTKLEEMDIFF